MPRLVYANLRTLLTLPEEQFSSGMGEVVKHGLIKNREYYQWLKDNREGIAARNLDLCQAMVYESCMIKKRVVEEDPTEQGERALLNFGHTLGHAVEKLENFTMHTATAWGWAALGLPVSPSSEACLQREEMADIRNTFLSFGIPDAAPGLVWEQVLKTTQSDKKVDAGVIRFVLLKAIGQAYVDTTVTADEMRAGFDVIGGQA